MMIPKKDSAENLDSAIIELEIPFYDVDGWNIVWHGNYFKYFEAARTELFRRKQLDVPECTALGYLWPVIDCQARFIAPARYGMRLQVTAILEDIEHRIKVRYEIHEKVSGKKLVKGYTIQVAVHKETGEMCLATPDVFLDLLRKK